MAFTRINGIDLYTEVDGAGEPVLFLHGGFCSLESLRFLSDAVVADHTVHAFERPGHGRSADIDEAYSYRRSLADTVAYLDAHELESVHVVGYSDGGILALMLALEHPERVRSVVAISANLDPSAFSTAEEHGRLLLTPAKATTDVGAGAAERPDLERQHYERLSPDGPEHGDVVLDKLLRLWTTEPNIEPAELAVIDAPVLIIAGDRDSIRPDHSLLIAASIPGAQLCIVPGATHGLLAERPALLTLVIRGFLT
ncbi:alpha/beta hydrolase [Plantibacter flavus]|uniref:alpha/beta fold hydrolase n=1 Tax=Plantibacter flavus TaxID=150123 RepID=UPI003F174594